MGYMRHHAIIVTSFDKDVIAAAHAKAEELRMSVTAVTEEGVNGYRSFLVAPDGSKEGWRESDRGDVLRAALVEWLNTHRYEDGSSMLDWVEVQFGDSDKQTRIVRDSDHPEDD